MRMIRDILMYMDRVYVVHNNVNSVYDLGLQLFRENVARASKIKDRLLSTMLSLIHKERTSEVIDRTLLKKSLTQMLIDLGISSRAVYEDDFEKPFLETTSNFYRLESQEFISSNACPDYMRKVENRIKEEMERVAHYLDASTEPKLKEVIDRELIKSHMKTLVDMENSGLVVMLRDDKVEDLQRMYSLFGRVDGLKLVKEIMSTYIRDTGKALVNDENKNKDPVIFVQSLLDLKDKYDRLLEAAFHNDKSFQSTVNLAFEQFINVNPKSPEFLSLFIDEKLKKGLKGVSEEEVEITLDKVMTLFRFIQEKDVFEKYYKQHLAKRLLLGRSVSDDAERNMIAKLKTECGYQFTSKLEGMFTDMRLSTDTMENFKNYIKNDNKLGGIELGVHVLTTGFWPTQPAAKCVLPAEIAKCCEVFKKFYLSNHSGRRLTWQTNMGNADLKAFFGKEKHELNVTTYQMCILMLFNNAPKLSYNELLQQTAIPVPELKRNLLSLSCAKYKILAKDPKSKDIGEQDIFWVNDEFTCKLFKVKVMTVAHVESEPERVETRQKVDEDRKHQIEAALVRVMKSRKTMEHSNLIAEVTKQLSARFVPNPILIKKRIESLIEREYLERNKTDRKMYNYLA